MLLGGPASAQETIEYKNSQLTLIDNVNVASLDPGNVERVLVQPGQEVTQGQLLVALDRDIYEVEARTADFQAKIAAKESENDVDLRFARKSIEVNQKRLNKSVEAVKEFAKSISETEIDRLNLELEQSVLSAEQAVLQRAIGKLTLALRKEQQRAAEIQLNRRNIVSPINGMVVEVSAQQGEAVSGGTPIVRVISLDKLRVKAVFPANYALRVHPESKSHFELVRDGKTIRFPTKVFFVNPEVRTSEKVFEVWADVDNADQKLLPGFKGKLVIEL